MTSPVDFQAHRSLENEFLQARLDADWQEFRSNGMLSITEHIRESSRSGLVTAVQKLVQAKCREDVLFPCLLVFLNSQNEGVPFPWASKFKPILNGLKKTRDTIQEVMNSPGFQTLASHSCVPSLSTFSDFVCSQRSFLKSAEKYEFELGFILKGLPPKYVVRQYGRAVISMYVQAITGRISSHLNALLSCFMRPGEDINLLRDLQDFKKKYADFCEHAAEFLQLEHKSATRRPLVLDWARFSKTGHL